MKLYCTVCFVCLEYEPTTCTHYILQYHAIHTFSDFSKNAASRRVNETNVGTVCTVCQNRRASSKPKDLSISATGESETRHCTGMCTGSMITWQLLRSIIMTECPVS